MVEQAWVWILTWSLWASYLFSLRLEFLFNKMRFTMPTHRAAVRTGDDKPVLPQHSTWCRGRTQQTLVAFPVAFWSLLSLSKGVSTSQFLNSTQRNLRCQILLRTDSSTKANPKTWPKTSLENNHINTNITHKCVLQILGIKLLLGPSLFQNINCTISPFE